MELLQLQYFVEIARQESYTLAAQSLHVSQPALSQTIKRLEKELGVELFERVGRRIHLTAKGKTFYASVSHSLWDIQSAYNNLKNERVQGNVTIGSYVSIKAILPCLDAFSKENPEVTYTLLQIFGVNQSQYKKLDALIYHDLSNTLDFNEHICIGHSRGVFVVPNHNASEESASTHTPIPLSDLENSNFVSLTNDEGWIEEFFQNYSHGGRVPNIRYLTNCPAIKMALLEEGLAVGSMNLLMLQNMKETGKYTVIPRPVNTREIAIHMGWWDTSYLSPAARALKKFTIQWFADEAHQIKVDEMN